jgi:hypothetical protein
MQTIRSVLRQGNAGPLPDVREQDESDRGQSYVHPHRWGGINGRSIMVVQFVQGTAGQPHR